MSKEQFTTVNVPGVGPVNFPASMKPDEINAAAKGLYDQARRDASLQRSHENIAADQASNDPTAGMSTLDRVGAGAGVALTDNTQGLRQLAHSKVAGHAANALRTMGPGLSAALDAGRAFTDPVTDEEVIEKRRRDAPILATTAGKVGNIGANLAAGAVAGGGGGTLVRALAAGALAGGAGGAVQPVTEDESRLSNVATGALTGAAGGGAGKLVGDVAGAVAQRLTPRGADPADVGAGFLTDAQREAVEAADRLGLQLTPAQRTGNRALSQIEASLESKPLSSAPFNRIKDANQQKANELVAEALGVPEAAGKATMLRAAKDRIGGVYQRVADDRVRTADVLDVNAKLREAADEFDAITDVPLMSDALVKRYTTAVASGQATGKRLQDISNQLRLKIKDKQTSHPSYALALQEVKEQVDDLLQEGLDDTTAELFKRARSQYRLLKQLESPGVFEGGNVSLTRFGNVLKRDDKRGFLYSNNRTPLYEAVRVAKAWPKIADSGTATRSQINNFFDVGSQIPGRIASEAYLRGGAGGMKAAEAAGRGAGASLRQTARALELAGAGRFSPGAIGAGTAELQQVLSGVDLDELAASGPEYQQQLIAHLRRRDATRKPRSKQLSREQLNELIANQLSSGVQ
jgi:hypothetical protein